MAGLRDLAISPRRVIPARMLSARFSRAGGPGGQNVNKLATRVELILDLEAAAAVLSDDATARIRRRLQRRLDARGRLRVVCSRARTQGRNLELACERMEELLRQALTRAPARRPTRPSRRSREARLAAKRARGETKRGRRVDLREL